MTQNLEVVYSAPKEPGVDEDEIEIRPNPPNYVESEAKVVESKPVKLEDAKYSNIKKWVTIALIVIPMFVILLNTFVKKDDLETTRKIETVSNALYKILQIVANNPQALGITGVDGKEGKRNDLSNFDFESLRRNFTKA